jgi:hypothetical protein
MFYMDPFDNTSNSLFTKSRGIGTILTTTDCAASAAIGITIAPARARFAALLRASLTWKYRCRGDPRNLAGRQGEATARN